MTVIKRLGEDFQTYGGALTLCPSYVDSDETLYKENSSGWFIRGRVYEDWFAWVNDFDAYHPEKGWKVKGNFEDNVEASNEEAFQHFWEYHKPLDWDYGDI
jgi:hypothetical protein